MHMYNVYKEVTKVFNRKIRDKINQLKMQMQKFHQRRKSQRGITVMVKGSGIPLYGGGASLGSVNGKPVEPVPMNLQFTVRSRANVLGKLVKPKFYKSVDCSVLMDPTNMNKPISLKNKCTYRSSAQKYIIYIFFFSFIKTCQFIFKYHQC